MDEAPLTLQRSAQRTQVIEEPGMSKLTVTMDDLKRYQNLHILVMGDIILDRYIWGSVERTSPEAPVPIVRVESESWILGGAANVAHNLVSMGAKVSLFGVIGEDDNAAKLKQLLDEIGIKRQAVVADASRPTILKTRVLAQGQQMIRVDREKEDLMSGDVRQRLLAQFKKAVKKVDGVVLSDYSKGLLTADFLTKIISAARAARCPTVCDPKGLDFAKYRGVDVLTPNLKEAQSATRIAIKDDASLRKAGFTLLRDLRSKAIAITRGAEGVTVFYDGSKTKQISAHRREVFDVTGAGDTFISHLALALFAGSPRTRSRGALSGAPIVEAAELANCAAAIAVTKLGVATITPGELLAFIHEETAAVKRKSLPELQRIVLALRNRGKKIVFTNGCFDLLHIGHIEFLQQARRLGDCLIVGLNSDGSVRKLKGPPRPILNEDERADILSALHCVDFVIVFYEDTPELLLRTLRPDVLVKGKNVPAHEVVGNQIVRSYGGEVKRLPLFRNVSTSQLLEGILKGTPQSAAGRK
jgi:D-beta-D-heptose 7-phosphate kinase/D-beta-D-heptose 1-phosphate adenosyltransferase